MSPSGKLCTFASLCCGLVDALEAVWVVVAVWHITESSFGYDLQGGITICRLDLKSMWTHFLLEEKKKKKKKAAEAKTGSLRFLLRVKFYFVFWLFFFFCTTHPPVPV